ncbi:TPA: restriction endonuclease [Enterobacter roggenkampii]|nr:restriction endonuclease [Enterobacter roggenkampii]
MNNYDFKRINDKEFEDLVIDLLQLEHPDVVIERFMGGRDGGIDGRFHKISDTVIIQCKHYVKSTYSSLLTSLKTEAPKVKAQNPDRYILAICQDLSSKRKNDIIKIIGSQYLKSDDIITMSDITHRISRNPHIERKYYKLWLNSTSLLVSLLHNDIVGKSLDYVEEIKENAEKYIRTQDYHLASNVLDVSGVIIITGAPGVGKTTLAEQMCLDYIIDGYQLILIEDDISEAEKLFIEDSKQFFLYDDFLGRNYLDALRNKEDSKIVRFIKRIGRCKNKKLVLTSRTTILNQGKLTSEIFDINNTQSHEYEVEIKNLDIIDKAKVLYNHLWLSELPQNYLDNIWIEKRYQTIVSHHNYNPRLISYLTDYKKVEHLSHEDYWEHITKSLDNPSAIWHHMFTKQIPVNVYYLTYLTSLNNGEIEEEKLKNSHENFLDLINFDRTQERYIPFSECIRLSVKSTLQRKIGHNNVVRYDVLNPSVSDYLTNKINENKSTIPYYFSALTTVRSLFNLKNLSLKHLTKTDISKCIQSIFDNIDKDKDHDYVIEFIKMTINHPQVNDEMKLMVAKLFDSKILPFSPSREEYKDDITRIIIWLMEKTDNLLSKNICLDYLNIALSDDLDDFNSEELTSLSRLAVLLNDSRSINILKGQLISHWQDFIHDFIKDTSDFHYYNYFDEVEDLTIEVRNYIKDLLSESTIIFTRQDIDSILAHFDPQDIIENNISASSHEYVNSKETSINTNDFDAVDAIFHRD